MNDLHRLSGPSHGPDSGGPAKQLVVLLHGWGADGNDLIGLAPELAGALPDALFLSPNGPEPCDANPMGRQWFGLMDRSEASMLTGARAVAPSIDAFLDAELARLGLGDDALALIGFSQGTMMALHIALRRARPCAGVIGFSGLLIAPETLAAEVKSRPPTLLVHGEADPVVPFAALGAAATALEAAGIPVRAQGSPGLGHGIDGTGLGLCAAHLRGCLLGDAA